MAFVESWTFSKGAGPPIGILTFLLFMSPCMSPTLFFVITYAYRPPLCDHLLLPSPHCHSKGAFP